MDFFYLLFQKQVFRDLLFVIFFLINFRNVEVEYDAQRDEKEQHEAKMKEVRKVEELRKEKEAESREINFIFILFK